MNSLSAKRLVFTGKQRVELQPVDLSAPGDDEVLIETHYSLMSTGTENIVFNRLFDPGTHWDDWVKYPFYPGYASVGKVLAVGSNVEEVSVGQRVTHRKGHCSHAIVPAVDCSRIPDEVPFEQAVWYPLGKIGFHGAQAAQYKIGDSVLIIGAGPIGQMSVRWAKAAGAISIIAADMAVARLRLATDGGATAVVAESIESARAGILAANGGKLPRVAIDSTGNAAVFAAALGLAADFGRVVVLGDTGQPAQQKLTMDVITRGLTIVGAHDAHNTAEWNLRTIVPLFFELVAQGRFSLEGLNSHSFRPESCAEAYVTANRDRSKTMGILFCWKDGE